MKLYLRFSFDHSANNGMYNCDINMTQMEENSKKTVFVQKLQLESAIFAFKLQM